MPSKKFILFSQVTVIEKMLLKMQTGIYMQAMDIKNMYQNEVDWLLLDDYWRV